MAASSLVGQRVGANDTLSARKVGYEVVRVALTYMTALGLAVAVFSRFLAHPFSSDERVAELSSTYLVLAGLSEPGLALAMVVGGVIRSAGNTIVPLAVNALCLYLVRVAPSTILVDYEGVIDAWIAMAVDVYVGGLVLFFIFSSYFGKLARRIV
ncbi:MAG: MATE family efflux transporter [Sulfolobales archaeon]|nr:MATE family efflux transporter [Sulfolobales archaeon]MCX8208957.1 MATE family efflux transporter [Sulfolobales archaeon]MDW8010569.1 MATE family efflux transporter [Sulfolobales archaeon]